MFNFKIFVYLKTINVVIIAVFIIIIIIVIAVVVVVAHRERPSLVTGVAGDAKCHQPNVAQNRRGKRSAKGIIVVVVVVVIVVCYCYCCYCYCCCCCCCCYLGYSRSCWLRSL